jgi:WD40 repeat protein
MQFSSIARPALCSFLLCGAVLAETARIADGIDPREAISISALARMEPVDFATEVLPILKANCLACHNPANAKAELSLEAPEDMLRGGTSGPVIVAGNRGKSRLLLVAARRAKPLMPPRNRVGAKSLTPDELGLLRLWIDQGAKGSAPIRPAPIVFQPPPPSLRPILALALSPDSKYVACSRADQFFVYDLPGTRLVARLTDPALSGPPRAHIDLVRSLAFSLQGDLLASGGFRTVKVWQRPRAHRKSTITLGAVASTAAMSPTGACGLLPSCRRDRTL